MADEERHPIDEPAPPRDPRGRRRLRVAAMAAVALGVGATAAIRERLRARNFTDPNGPRFAACCEAAPERAALRVVTFNIQYAREIDGAIRLFRDTAALRDADVVMLQEMDETGVGRIAEALSLRNYIYYPAAINHGRNFGNAILSRWPLEDDAKLILPHLAIFDRSQRIAVRATVRIGERRVRLYSLHLATLIEQWPGARRDQALAVVADADGSADPVIIAGDTNTPGLWKAFDDRGYRCASRDLGGTRGRFAIDHIFARGLAPPGPAARGLVHGHDDVSDHRAVWAVLGP
jgi:endonuclease/exonuclease/phosphatase family metal-dependent hydrolase